MRDRGAVVLSVRRREWSGDGGQLDNIRVKRFKPVGEMILVGGGAITTTDA